MKRHVLSLYLLVTVFFGYGCQHLPFVQKDDFNKKIDDVRVELATKLEEKNNQIIEDQAELMKDKDKLAREASGLIYGALTANYMKTNPDRIDDIERFRMEAAFAKLPTPDAETLIKERQELTKELDEKNTTLAQLETKYKAKIQEAEIQKKELAAKEKAIEDEKKQKEELKNIANAKEIELRKAQKEKDDARIAKQQKDIENAQDEEKRIRILIYIFTGFGILAGVAAYLIKSLELAGVSAISIGLAILVAVLEPWQLAIGVLVMFGLMWFGYHRKYKREKITKENVIGAVQEAKQVAGEEYKKILQPKLKEWFENDKAGEKHVEQTLKELNLK